MTIVFMILALIGVFALVLIIFKALQTNLMGHLERFERSAKDDALQLRQELNTSLLTFNTALSQMVQGRLDKLNTDNCTRLDQMRAVVDEKLHTTLEKRFNESFSLVSERLEKVHQGLGAMQALAADVGGLKRILNNVKTRGTWGEVQLDTLMSQMLDPSQYQKNVHITGTLDVVEFAIALPDNVFIPIDSKFPLEDYERLVQAQENADASATEQYASDLEKRLKTEAKRIKDKYIYPPKTTDFALMFLPTEGLYAEVIRRPGLVSDIQNKYRVSICGPSTLCAFLNSLQMGFKTLAIQKHSCEVWEILRQAKEEFERYGLWTEKVRKYLELATKTLDDADKRTRAVQRKLKTVSTAPDDAKNLNSPDETESLTNTAQAPALPLK